MVLEIHCIEASRKEGGNWAVDSSQRCGTLRTRAYDIRRAIKRALTGMGLKPGGERLCVTFDGHRYEVSVIATGEPLYIVTRVG
jgi:hypothetical protein